MQCIILYSSKIRINDCSSVALGLISSCKQALITIRYLRLRIIEPVILSRSTITAKQATNGGPYKPRVSIDAAKQSSINIRTHMG